MSDALKYPNDYFTSRQWFLEAANAAHAELTALEISTKGPKGESLTIDVATWDKPDAPYCILISSGLHGAECPFGAAIQIEALHRQLKDHPKIKLVYLHSLSPYAFVHQRRFNEQNIDPNRNFLLSSDSYQGSPETYRQLDYLLNPKKAPNRWDFFKLRIALFGLLHGPNAVKQAVAGGQFDYPEGIFFGGHGPSETTRYLQQHLPNLVGNAREIIHLDFHTGLGPWGTYKLLLDPPISAQQFERLDAWFGKSTYEISEATGEAYEARGSFGPWCVEQFPGRNYLYLCAEFGTYSTLEVLAASREENQAYHYTAPDSPLRKRAQTRMQEAFSPASPEWRKLVVQQGIDLIQRSLNGFAQLG